MSNPKRLRPQLARAGLSNGREVVIETRASQNLRITSPVQARVPLSNQYLRAWGDDWKRRAPFRLNYYNNEPATKERPALVVLSTVLPDAYNLGYQDTRLLVLDRVNGKLISRLSDVEAALASPVRSRSWLS